MTLIQNDGGFWAEYEQRRRRERIAAGEPTHDELVRFIAAELESPVAAAGFGVHPTHQPQTDRQMQAENPEGGRYCMRCCRIVEVKLGTTVHGMNPCDGPHHIELGDDDVLRRLPLAEGN